MILLVHMLFGAAIGSAVANIPLAIILAFLGHYFLDLFPHVEYDIQIKNKKQWREKLISVFKIAADFFSGLLLIFLFSKNYSTIYVCAFFAMLPDGFTVLNNHLSNKIFKNHNQFHTGLIHFLKNKKISNFWRILSQVMVVIVSIVILKIYSI